MAKIKFDMKKALATVPEEPEDFTEYCYQQMPPIAIYYKRRRGFSECRCGKCGGEFHTLQIPVRKELAECELCGNKGYWEWQKVTRYEYFKDDIGLIQCTTDGNLVIRTYELFQKFQRGYIAKRTIQEKTRHFLYLGDVFKIECANYWRNEEKRWECAGSYSNCGGSSLYPGWRKEIKKSVFKYCDTEFVLGHKNRYWTYEHINVLFSFANNPAIEMYAKAGMKKLVNYLVQHNGKTSLINRRAKSLKSQLRIEDKSRINFLIREKGDTVLLTILQEERKQKAHWKDEQIVFLREVYGNYEMDKKIRYLLNHMSLQKLINRTEKYKKDYYNSNGGTISAYVDYLRMREELGYSLENEVYRFPDNLKEKHDLMVKEKLERADELHTAKMRDKYPEIAERYTTLCKKYCYEQEGMFIRPAKNAVEIVTEGRVLHHCVGRETYLEKHAKGKSFILFLRKTETPDVPYYTIEIKDTEIVQWYGIRDTKPDITMVEPWLNDFAENLLNKEAQNDLKVTV